EQWLELPAAPGLADGIESKAQPDQPDHLVDDQLAHVQREDRQEGADHAQAEAGHAQRGTGRPDLAQERRQVAHRIEALAQAGPAVGAAGLGGGFGPASAHAGIVHRDGGRDAKVASSAPAMSAVPGAADAPARSVIPSAARDLLMTLEDRSLAALGMTIRSSSRSG